MLKKKKILIGITTVAAIVVFAVTLVGAVFYNGDEIPLHKASASAVKKNSLLYPVRLTIPKIKVDAKVDQVGITKKGNMATPGNFGDVGWYKYGAIPGAKGTAVIAGHVDNGLAFPAVFSNLNKLQKGDSIYILNKKNKRAHFVVTGSNVYDFNAPTKGIFADQSGRSLKLITCAGNWLSEYKTHDKRLVVTAIMVK